MKTGLGNRIAAFIALLTLATLPLSIQTKIVKRWVLIGLPTGFGNITASQLEKTYCANSTAERLQPTRISMEDDK